MWVYISTHNVIYFTYNFTGQTIEVLRNSRDYRRPGRPIFSPDPNRQCKFPFILNGNVITKCTIEPTLADEWYVQYIEGQEYFPHFCATEVDKNNNMIEGRWGYCSHECSEPIDHQSEPKLPTPRFGNHDPRYMRYYDHHLMKKPQHSIFVPYFEYEKFNHH